MAKNNRRTTVAVIGLIVTVIVIIAAIVKGYTSLEAEVKHQEKTHTETVEMIKSEGCLPARKAKTDIQLIKQDIGTIKDTQKRMDGKLDRLLERP